MTPEARALARRHFPRRKGAQAHFVRGFLAARGDEFARAALVGSYSESDGARAAELRP